MKTLFDLRGLVIRSLHSGKDAEPVRLSSGEEMPSIGHCLNNFIKDFLLPGIKESRLNDIIAVRDGGNDYRKALYPDYKANRKDTDPDVSQHYQMCEEAVVELLKGLGIPLARIPGVEADDILAYLVNNLPGQKMLYTVDQDLLQLGSPGCLVFLKTTPNLEGYELYSSSPKQLLCTVTHRHVALMKSIVGDSSDNYGGVKGLGPKAFADLQTNYGADGLDELVAIIRDDDFDKLSEVIRQTGDKTLVKLYENRDAWKLGWQLANLAPELVGRRNPWTGKFDTLQWTKRVPNPTKVNTLLAQHGCSYLYPNLKAVLPTQTLITADKLDAIPRLVAAIAQSPVVAIDWETSDQLQHPAFREASKGREFVDMLSSTITSAGITFGKNYEHTVYLSFDHADTNNLDRSVLLDVLGAISPDTEIAIQNTMFENTLLRVNFNGAYLDNCYDIKVMSSHVNENSPNGLKDSSREHLNYNQIRYEDVIEKGKRMCDYNAEHCFQYGADDPLVTAHLFDHYKMITELEGTWEFFAAYENAPIEMISDGFVAGVSLDVDELARQRAEDETNLAKNLSAIRQLIVDNQTEETIQSGVSRLYNEQVEECIAKVKSKGKEKGDSPEQIESTATEECRKLWKKLEESVRYEPFEEEEEVVSIDLTPSAINPLLEKLGIPRLEAGLDALQGKKPADFLKKQELVAAWAKPYEGVSEEAADFLRLLVPAVPYNDTSASKLAKGEGRSHPCYQEWKAYAYKLAGEPKKRRTYGFEMNLGSPIQMQVLLYGMLDLPVLDSMRGFEVSDTRKALGITTPTPQANEDAMLIAMAEACEGYPWKVEALKALTAAKKCQTRLSLFYNVYPLWVHPKDGMIHPQVNSCGTETRRPTGSSPNPLQWPKRGDGVKFRRCILPNQKLGHDLIVSIDWSQQELRVAAALSMDEAMLDCYIGNNVAHVISDTVKGLLGEQLLKRFLLTGTKDIHTQTASGLLGWAYEQVENILDANTVLATEEDKKLFKQAKQARTTAKPINFGGAYGIGQGKLSRQLTAQTGIPHTTEQAKKYLQDKKTQYWGFERWREAVVELVCQQGFVTTAFGSRRHVQDQIATSDEREWSAVCRQVVNYLIQGVCADNLKRTMTDIWRQGILQRTGAKLIAPIYDELVFSVHSSQADNLIMLVHALMTKDIPGMAVPMLAEPSLGVNFGDQIEIGSFPTPELIEKAMAKAFDVGRRLMYHPESDSYFTVTDDRDLKGGLGTGEVFDVTGMPEHEQAAALQKAA